jgi:hypothetical protein
MPLLSQSTTTGGMVPSYEKEAAFRINCVIILPRISPRYDPADVSALAQVSSDRAIYHCYHGANVRKDFLHV